MPDLDLNNVAHVLDFEARWEGRNGPKASEILQRFGVKTARYYQVLTRHLESRAALEHDPALTRRLTELHARRRTARATRTFRR